MAKKKRKGVAAELVRDSGEKLTDYRPVRTLGYRGTKAWAVQDKALQDSGIYSILGQGVYGKNVPAFLGYMALASLSQDGVIKAGVDLRADEMTRKWIEFRFAGENGDDIITGVEDELNRLHVQKIFRDAAQMCALYGGCLAYIDTGENLTEQDLRLPLGTDADTIKGIKALKLIEPFYISPGRYSCFNPIDKDYFVPQSWLINGREVHASRFLYFAEDKPPTLLLPSYNFFGVPLVQSVLDAVAGFEESSKSAARMLSKYACTVFKTDMNEVLSGGSGSEIANRIAYFAKYRDNDGVMTIDKESEDIILAQHALGGVTDIVRQQMEIVAAMFGEPAVKLWGISPNGFNATGESDIKAHYDHINAVQERILREPLEYLVKLIQLKSFGEVSEELSFEFVPLEKENEKLQAEIQKIKVDSMAELFDRGIISGEEARHALAVDAESGFDDIDENELPEPPSDLALPLEGAENEEP